MRGRGETTVERLSVVFFPLFCDHPLVNYVLRQVQ